MTLMAKIAVIETGGKQYVVTDGSVISVEKLPETNGGTIAFEKVLLVDDCSQAKGAKVSAELIEEGRSKKVTVIHYRAKSRYFKKRGHRQHYNKIKITALP